MEKEIKRINEAEDKHIIEHFGNDNTTLYLNERKDYEEAIRCFDKALELTPNNSNALFGKKTAYENLIESKKINNSNNQIYCPICGNQLNAGAKFCGSCGSRL